MIENTLSKIWLTPRAAEINERIHVSCPVAETPKEVRAILTSGKRVSLSQLWPYFKVSPVNFLLYAQKNKKKLLDIEDLLVIFGGKSHLDECQTKTKNPHAIIPASGQIFSERMKAIDINLDTEFNLAEFILLDILTLGNITKKSGAIATINIENIILENVALPKNLEIKNEYVILHYGAVMLSPDQSQLKKMMSIHRFQLKNPFFKKALIKLKNKTINCSNCCASASGKGFDLTKWFFRKAT